MNISAPFIARPVATTLLTVAIALAGALAFFKLPVAPVPQVDIPTVRVLAQLPGASPETVANSVASPLERHLGQIADVTEMTSSSSLGLTSIALQFGLDRNIDGAARDVQAGINAARADLPTNLRTNPTYRKVNPADAPIVILALTSKTLTRGQMYDAASNVLQQRLSQLEGVGQVIIGGATLPAVRVELNPDALNKYGVSMEDVRAALASANANSPKGVIEQGSQRFQIYDNDQATQAADYAPLVIAYRNGDAVRLRDVATVLELGRRPAQRRIFRRGPGGRGDSVHAARRQYHRHGGSAQGGTAAHGGGDARRLEREDRRRQIADHPRLVGRHRGDAGDRHAARDHGRVFFPARRARDDHPEHRRAGLDHRLVRRHVSRRFQPRHSFAHGLDHRHGLRRGRCGRRRRKHLATPGSGNAAPRGGDAGSARGRLYGVFDQHVADRGVHADPVHGRHSRTVFPRIRVDSLYRHSDFARHFPDDDADAVRPVVAAKTKGKGRRKKEADVVRPHAFRL